MKRLLITRPLPAATLRAAKARFDVTARDADIGLTSREAAEAMANYDAILPTLGDQFTADAFAGEIRCGVLANFGVGYNHIDVAAAQAAGVLVSNTPDVVTDATADIGLTLILSACRRAGEGERLVRAGKWTGWAPTQMLGQHVTGKTVGIVGMGRIGQAVARRCHFGFGMPVLYFNRSAKAVDFPARQIPDLSDLMAQSDIVVVTVPGGGPNVQLIDAAAIAAMRPTSVLINIARGDVIDEDALIAALAAQKIAAAGLDVYANEPVVPDGLRGLDNVVLLPHLGTAALEVREAMGQMALDNLIAWDAGNALPQAV
ncbi:D-glycerate dehydrogenase [Yoonia sp. SS1-5]|uniref:2-hydroxyacid dehydrogenase n=1 Tax=Yoonia rhodophyticola TaxID=3137370 RepID=A0AAN0MDG3_9RHOB